MQHLDSGEIHRREDKRMDNKQAKQTTKKKLNNNMFRIIQLKLYYYFGRHDKYLYK